MKTSQASYLDFLGTQRVRMVIPVFQRVYTWSVWQCEELLGDIRRAGSRQDSHFMGCVVYTQEDIQGPGFDRLFQIVDGQQRTTTLTLLLIALRDYLREQGGQVGGLDADALEQRYLYVGEDAGCGSAAAEHEVAAAGHGGEGPRRVAKFMSASADRQTMAHVLEGAPEPEPGAVSCGVLDNYRYFKDSLADEADLELLWQGLCNLQSVIIQLNDGDNPQLIFEGLNSKGVALATSDLLRNKLFYGTAGADQEYLLKTYWEPLEEVFAEDEDQINFNAALRCWLVGKDAELSKYSRHELYSAFRKFINQTYTGTSEELMKELLAHCKLFNLRILTPQAQKHVEWAKGNALGGGHKIFG